MEKRRKQNNHFSKSERAVFLAWLRANYHLCPNNTIACEMFGISKKGVYYWAKKLGLTRPSTPRREAAKEKVHWHFEKLKTENGGQGFEDFKKRCSESRHALLRVERLRAKYGLPQKTRIKVYEANTRRLTQQRWYLTKIGYIVDMENRMAYWTGDTKRGERVERESRFFKFAEYGSEAEAKPRNVYVRPAYDGDIYFN
jgi:hypothetical protein